MNMIPKNPFPYFTEVMTGFEDTAAIGMLQEGLTEDGLKCITNIRNRYDGMKRSPYNEAECGHHYGRAMASWSAVLSETGFLYSGVSKEIKFADKPGKFFWSNGYAYGMAEISKNGEDRELILNVINGDIDIARVTINGFGTAASRKSANIRSGEKMTYLVEAEK
jgi:non-lysosomal glucosylceramidase